jgi:hypothetical protein
VAVKLWSRIQKVLRSNLTMNCTQFEYPPGRFSRHTHEFSLQLRPFTWSIYGPFKGQTPLIFSWFLSVPCDSPCREWLRLHWPSRFRVNCSWPSPAQSFLVLDPADWPSRVSWPILGQVSRRGSIYSPPAFCWFLAWFTLRP